MLFSGQLILVTLKEEMSIHTSPPISSVSSCHARLRIQSFWTELFPIMFLIVREGLFVPFLKDVLYEERMLPVLVLRRKVGERLRIGSTITLTVLACEGDRVKLGIDAPPEVVIVREELLAAPPHLPLLEQREG